MNAKKRVALLFFKEEIPASWLEAHLGIKGYERADGSYAAFEDITGEEFYEMCRSGDLNKRYREFRLI